MEALSAPKTYTVQEYFELEKTSELRHEFYRGEIFAMAGATLNHNEIVQNMTFALRDHFRPKGCRVFSESVKLEVIRDVYYPYPDIMLTCHPDDLRAQYVVKHPGLIVEVLSDSTADHDRGFKWQNYQRIPSLKHYLLIFQNEYRAELYSRNVDFWKYEVFTEPSQQIAFEHLDFQLPLSEIYQNVVVGE
ncbi:Uma2 family endonuclease [Tellurirhabdus rosea]|uniref:Uma2 family endonuclease n=1 Tax=Tellurirhabdus rosea TaxID=2674997 RepID=UPI002257CEF8|nr:Uma2 family endonuclease [Tellurirhabdus rosea]